MDRLPENPVVASLIKALKVAANKHEAPIWRTVSKKLQRPRRRKIVVNLSKIARYTKDGEAVVVPGKVLGSGELDRPITVAAVAFSKSAQEKIAAANGKAIKIMDLVEENPKGSRVRIIA
ncbi:MAG: 50S ribosomal protein L18e [Methanobacteriota archaeon]|nr:MAG: 50S ribosomal protein L18e [Euryarchaeota archaeon]